MGERNREPVPSELEAEIARTCGVLNATTGHLVSLLAQVMESGCWQVAGIHSASQWMAWHCGVSPARAKALLSMARRAPSFRSPPPPMRPFGHRRRRR